MTFGRRIAAQLSRSLAGILLLSSLAAGCSDDPTLGEWESAWHEVESSLPPLQTMLELEDHTICSTTLGELRQAVADLESAPNDDISGAFLDWAEFAEGVFFECPLQRGSHAGFPLGYEEMARLASEVDALIAFEHGLGSG